MRLTVVQYLKLFEENLCECLPEVRRAKDGLDDDHSSVARVHQQVSDGGNTQTVCGLMGVKNHYRRCIRQTQDF